MQKTTCSAMLGVVVSLVIGGCRTEGPIAEATGHVSQAIYEPCDSDYYCQVNTFCQYGSAYCSSDTSTCKCTGTCSTDTDCWSACGIGTPHCRNPGDPTSSYCDCTHGTGDPGPGCNSPNPPACGPHQALDSACRCVCANEGGCNWDETWNTSSCTCVCNENTGYCPAWHVWNCGTQTCTCPAGTTTNCGPNEGFNPDTCRCE
jgi:hypothetical protein